MSNGARLYACPVRLAKRRHEYRRGTRATTISTSGYRQFDIARAVDALRRFLEISGLG